MNYRRSLSLDDLLGADEPDHAAARANASAWARDLLSRNDWLLLDTETTGLGDDAEVVQVVVVRPDGTPVFDSLFRPTVPIQWDATKVHGIDDAKVADAPRFAERYDSLVNVIGGYETELLAYNAAFDRRMLRQTCERYGLPLAALYVPWQCVMERYAACVGEWSTLHQSYRFQPLPGGDHTALGDCRATLALLQQMAVNG